MDATTILILLIFGIIIGIIATIAGVGGGVMYVPVLVLLIGLPINEAIDTSTFAILFNSTVGFFSYLKQRRTNLKLAIIFASFAILGSLLCIFFLMFVPITNEILRILFGSLLIFTGILMAYKIYKAKRNNDTTEQHDIEYVLKDHDYKKDLKKGIPFFMLAGFTSYLLGIGGGVINTPSLNLIFGFPIHNATALSTSIVFFTSIFNICVKIFIGNINYVVGLFLGIGSILGALIGAKVSDKMPKTQLQAFVATILIFLGLNMLFSLT